MGTIEDISGGGCVQVNAPHVIHEAIEGEVIIINLATGSYYSLKGTAADAWGLIQGPSGVDAAHLVDAFATRYDTPRSEVEAALTPFLAELEEEGLVVSSAGTGEPAANAGDQWLTNGQAPFEPPSLEKFTDMQDLVLLDPVHEVDETGWPQPRPDVAVARDPS